MKIMTKEALIVFIGILIWFALGIFNVISEQMFWYILIGFIVGALVSLWAKSSEDKNRKEELSGGRK